MSIRKHLGLPRARVASIVCVLALGGAVALHHSPMPGHGMDMPNMGMMVCLAVLGLALAAVAAVTVPRRTHRFPPALRPSASEPWYAVRAPAARAGPPLFLRLASLRR